MSAMMRIDLNDKSRFHVLGPDWSYRLTFWDKAPNGSLLVDAEIIDGETRIPVQLPCTKTDDELFFPGDWLPAPCKP